MDFNVLMRRKDLEINLSPKKNSSSSTSSLNVLIEKFKKRSTTHDTVWYSAKDPRTGLTYYYEAETGETSWEKPPTSIPIRDREKETQRSLENELVGQPIRPKKIDEDWIDNALQTDFNPLSDVRASSTYRLLAARNLLQKCRLELATGVPIRLTENEPLH